MLLIRFWRPEEERRNYREWLLAEGLVRETEGVTGLALVFRPLRRGC